jgi:hypothetical protein
LCRNGGGKVAMRGFAGYLTIGVLAALAMGLVTVAGLGLAVGARPVAGRGAVIQHVDRTDKGDRLDLRKTLGGRPPTRQPAAVPVGCEPAFSPLAKAEHPNISGRCDS